MASAQPIWITEGAENWQVFARDGETATVHLWGGIRVCDAPGTVFARVISEDDSHPVVDWTVVTQMGERWSLDIQIPTGGPYRLETCAKLPHQDFKDAVGGQMRLHLFVGDLYLIAGQSNAVGYARDEFSDPPCIGVSVFRLDGCWDLATHPLNDGTSCVFANRDVPAPAHSPWLSFAKILYRKTGVPIGLLPAALGGSPMAAWQPGQLLYNNASEMVQSAGKPKAVLWYQGCADAIAGDTQDYSHRFLAMVQAFRRDMGVPTLPFFTCQLNGFTEPSTAQTDFAWADLRKQQSLCAEEEGIYLLPTAGMKLYDQIHNCVLSNIRIGRQIAAQVLANLYEQNLRWQSPSVAAVTQGKDFLEIQFDDVIGGLRLKRTVKQSFAAYCGDKPLTINKCTAQFDRIVLEGPALGEADTLSYAQTQNLTDAGIFDTEGDWVVAPFVVNLSPMANPDTNITIKEA